MGGQSDLHACIGGSTRGSEYDAGFRSVAAAPSPCRFDYVSRPRGRFRFPILCARVWNPRGPRDRIVALPAYAGLVATVGQIQAARATTLPACRGIVV